MDFSKYNVTLPYGDYTAALQEELERIDKIPLTRDEYNRVRELAPQAASQRILSIRRAYNQAQNEMRKLFEQDMEEEFGFSYLPNEVKERVHGAAWENGHSGGYSDVYACYPDIVDLVESVWNIAKKYSFPQSQETSQDYSFSLKHTNGDGSVSSNEYLDGNFASLDDAICYACNELPIEHNGWYSYVWVEDKDGKDVYVRPANCGNRA